jgi:hypothetical protein
VDLPKKETVEGPKFFLLWIMSLQHILQVRTVLPFLRVRANLRQDDDRITEASFMAVLALICVIHCMYLVDPHHPVTCCNAVAVNSNSAL